MLRIIQPIYSTSELPLHQPYTTIYMTLRRSLYITWNICKIKKMYAFCTELATTITRGLVRLLTLVLRDVIHVGATGSFIWFAVFRLSYKTRFLPNEWQVNEVYVPAYIYIYLREFITTRFDSWELPPWETNFICRIKYWLWAVGLYFTRYRARRWGPFPFLLS
jgi:hypothetical protein